MSPGDEKYDGAGLLACEVDDIGFISLLLRHLPPGLRDDLLQNFSVLAAPMMVVRFYEVHGPLRELRRERLVLTRDISRTPTPPRGPSTSRANKRETRTPASFSVGSKEPTPSSSLCHRGAASSRVELVPAGPELTEAGETMQNSSRTACTDVNGGVDLRGADADQRLHCRWLRPAWSSSCVCSTTTYGWRGGR